MSASKVLGIFCLTLILLLTVTGTGFAQDPQPPKPPDIPFEPSFPPEKYPPGRDQLGWGSPFLAQAASNVSTQALTLGAVGLSFRYLQTFGTTEVAYISDTAHINYPYGVGTDGANVWIADSVGLRALKYTNAGAIIQQIGKAGFRYGTGQSLEFVADIAADSGGNIWLVDPDASHILKFDANGNYLSKLGQSYDSGSDNSRFDGPSSIAFDGAGNIYVSDSWNERIQVFQNDGSYLATIGVTGVEGSDNGHFCNPQHIALVSSVLYVADACNHRVQLFNVTNPLAVSYLATIGVSGQYGADNGHFNNPLGVAVDAGRIYVADENNHRVQVFDRATRVYQATISQGWGNDNAHLRHPSDVAVDASGNIYVADYLNARVQQFNSSLAYVRTYGTTGVPYLTDDYHYNKPSGMAVAPDGNIYLTEEAGQRLIKLNAAGLPQWTVGQAGVVVDSDDNAHFSSPTDVAVAPSGLIYVADAGNNRIQIFNPDGSYYGTLGTGYGTGNYQFKYPDGLFITPNGTIYVADKNNHRVQIYNGSRVYVATMGETGVSGSDNAHFRSPNDVVVDANGIIYVSENGNYRVQVFNTSRAYVRTIGVTGVGGDGFDYLNGPNHLAVDARNNLYVASTWNHAVQVFDQNGAYLTTLGNSRGNRTGQLANPHGLALDSAGNLYVADFDNARIQKFILGTPGWRQSNINGFGELANRINSLASFGNQLYAGTYNFGGNGAQLWRSSDGQNWSAMLTNGFGDATNVGIDHLVEFNGKLYAGTWNSTNTAPNYTNGGQIWRSDGTTWEQVVNTGFGDPTNGEVMRFAVFNNQIYASTWSYTNTHGAEIWRSSTGNMGDWTKVVANGLGDAANIAVITTEIFNGYLYAGTYSWDSVNNLPDGCEVWRTANGVDWTQVVTDGFGNLNCYNLSSLTAFDDSLYAGTGIWDPVTQTNPGGQVWRCTAASGCDTASDWTQVTADGFGNPQNAEIASLRVFGGKLYAVTTNYPAGLEVWQTDDGTAWQQDGFAGFGDSNNAAPYYDNSVTVFNNQLFIGTTNWANGGEVWQMLNQIFLPLIMR